MSDVKDGGPAFPTQRALRAPYGPKKGTPDDPHTIILGDGGMSLRDWYAGKALQGVLSGQSIGLHKADDPKTLVAAAAYEYADAMLKARAS